MSNIITENLVDSQPVRESIERFCDKYVTASVLSSCGIKKQADIEETKPLEYIIPEEFNAAMPELADKNRNATPAKMYASVLLRERFLSSICFVFS